MSQEGCEVDRQESCTGRALKIDAVASRSKVILRLEDKVAN